MMEKKVKDEKIVQYTLRIPESIKKRVEKLSQEEMRSINNTFIVLILKGLNNS